MAIESYDIVIQKNDKFFQAFYFKGICLNILKKYTEASGAFDVVSIFKINYKLN